MTMHAARRKSFFVAAMMLSGVLSLPVPLAAAQISADARQAIANAERSGTPIDVVKPWPFWPDSVNLQCVRNPAGFVSVIVAFPAPVEGGVAMMFLKAANPGKAVMAPEAIIAEKDRPAIIAKANAMCASQKTASRLLVKSR